MNKEWCIHYTSIIGRIGEDAPEVRRCKAGILYRSVRPDAEAGVRDRRRYPCFDPEADNCPRRQYPTAEELAAYERQLAAHMDEIRRRNTAGLCWVCGRKIERKRQIGPCIYAEPCGDRLAQGRL